MTIQTIECQHCGAVMRFVTGPRPNVSVNTYWADCQHLDLEARRDKPGTIWPQRCGNYCFRSVPLEAAA